MILLKEACIKVLKAHPKEYIHVVNEYADFYEFITLDIGTTIEQYSFIFESTTVDKRTGELRDKVELREIYNCGEYKQYGREEIEELLK